MKTCLHLLLLFVLLDSSIFAAQPNINSEPVNWTLVKNEGNRLVLDGIFSVGLPSGGQWRKTATTTGPTGSPINIWECTVPADEIGSGQLIIMDVDLSKVPESERRGFMPTLAKAFRRTGIQAMERKGYVLEEFKIEDFNGTLPHSIRATSRFTQNQEKQINVTYFFPAGRIYIFGYEGPSENEPSWFVNSRKSFEYK